jgi:hypothetical protein
MPVLANNHVRGRLRSALNVTIMLVMGLAAYVASYFLCSVIECSEPAPDQFCVRYFRYEWQLILYHPLLLVEYELRVNSVFLAKRMGQY